MGVTESKENYLEIIHILAKKQKEVHAVDIANYLGFARASVSIALKTLKDEKYISVDDNLHITLTPKGKTVAKKVYDKHQTLSTWFMFMGVDEKTALKDACKIEHIISEKTFKAIKKFLKK